MLDETLLSMTGQPKVAYGNVAWGQSPGIDFACSLISVSCCTYKFLKFPSCLHHQVLDNCLEWVLNQ